MMKQPSINVMVIMSKIRTAIQMLYVNIDEKEEQRIVSKIKLNQKNYSNHNNKGLPRLIEYTKEVVLLCSPIKWKGKVDFFGSFLSVPCAVMAIVLSLQVRSHRLISSQFA